MQTISLDISRKHSIPPIYAKQSEVGRKFLAVITDNGVPYNIPKNSLLSVWYEGETDAGNYSSIEDRSAFSIDGNKVTVELVAQMLLKPGSGELCLSVSHGDGGETNTWNIPYRVEYKPGADSEEATKYYTAFKEVIDAARKFTVDKTLSVSGSPADASETGRQISVERARINELVSMKGTGDVTDFSASIDDMHLVNITSNGMAATISVQLGDISNGYSYIFYDIPEQFAPVSPGVVMGDTDSVYIVFGINGKSEANKLELRIYCYSDEIRHGSVYLDSYPLAKPYIAELAGIRVGFNGETYPTAGDAARGQIGHLNTTINGGYIDKKLTNIIGARGNFPNSNGWYATTSGAYSVSGNVATFTSASKWGGIMTLAGSAQAKFNITKGHKYYIFGMVKTSSNNIKIDFNGGSGGLRGAISTGAGEWEYIDYLGTATVSDYQPLTISDNGDNFGTSISVKKVGVIDLTDSFGEGKEPTIEEIRAYVNANDNWILESDYPVYTHGEIPEIKRRVESLESRTKYFSKLTAFIFGDSITATNNISADGTLTPAKTNWTTYAMEELGITNFYNFAKDGSTYHDVQGSESYQTFYKQFKLAKSKGITPDIIVVSLGTNDYQHPNTDTYSDAMAVQSLDALDRTNLHGALRYCYWALREEYPDVAIFVATPIQRPDVGVFTPLRDSIIKMAQTYCCHIIDAGVESGICKQFETWGQNGRHLVDGLHPNENGKRVLGHFYANCIRNNY